MIISLRGVSKSYREAGASRLILDRLSMEVEAGEFLSVTGPSGSGKSTLLNIIGAIDRADSGEVMVAGQAINKLNEHRRSLFRRHHLGFVFQFFNLIPTLTVGENLMLPLALTSQENDPDMVRSWLARVNLEDRQSAYPDVLSGGEQQRVAVVRAAIHKPGVVIADEPTGNLDQQAGNRVLELLAGLAKDGTTVVMATHSRQAASIADRHLVLDHGKSG